MARWAVALSIALIAGMGLAGCDRRESAAPTAAGVASAPGLPIPIAASAASAPAERCGWFVNPTPGNAWLIDADGEWLVGVQGGHQAEGDWPEFGPDQWVATNGSYGHGCACLRAEIRPGTRDVLRIVVARPRPLSVCRQDTALGGEPDGR